MYPTGEKLDPISIPRDTIRVMLLKFMLISAIKTPLLLDPTLWDIVCLRLAAGQWFSRLTPPIKQIVNSITEIFLKVVTPPCFDPLLLKLEAQVSLYRSPDINKSS